MQRRTLLAAAAAVPSFAILRHARAADTPGVTASDIKIGNTCPYSGPASAYGAIGRGLAAYFKRLNENGGIGGRKVTFLSEDDGYSPPRTVEETRKLVEQDGVSFILNGLGTPCQTAVQRYMNGRKVPQVFVSSGADKWANLKEFPWTIGWQPSYRMEGRIYAKYILSARPDARVAVLWQNDDFGKDYLLGLRDVFGDKYDRIVVKTASYESSDPTVDSQVVALQGSGADVLVTAAIPKFAAQTIRKVYDLGWKPLHLVTDVSVSTASVIMPAGPDRAVGLIAAAYIKDQNDPQWQNDAGMNEWRGFMKQYMPDADLTDSNFPYSYAVADSAVRVLKQCGDDLSRANIMHQATHLATFQPPTLLPGCVVGTSADNAHPIRHMQLQRWNGTRWELFGGVIDGSNV